nr:unnamed protein product [Callosobruchus analis]
MFATVGVKEKCNLYPRYC